jgi:hypothetical protein
MLSESIAFRRLLRVLDYCFAFNDRTYSGVPFIQDSDGQYVSEKVDTIRKLAKHLAEKYGKIEGIENTLESTQYLLESAGKVEQELRFRAPIHKKIREFHRLAQTISDTLEESAGATEQSALENIVNVWKSSIEVARSIILIRSIENAGYSSTTLFERHADVNAFETEYERTGPRLAALIQQHGRRLSINPADMGLF